MLVNVYEWTGPFQSIQLVQKGGLRKIASIGRFSHELFFATLGAPSGITDFTSGLFRWKVCSVFSKRADMLSWSTQLAGQFLTLL